MQRKLNDALVQVIESTTNLGAFVDTSNLEIIKQIYVMKMKPKFSLGDAMNVVWNYDPRLRNLQHSLTFSEVEDLLDHSKLIKAMIGDVCDQLIDPLKNDHQMPWKLYRFSTISEFLKKQLYTSLETIETGSFKQRLEFCSNIYLASLDSNVIFEMDRFLGRALHSLFETHFLKYLTDCIAKIICEFDVSIFIERDDVCGKRTKLGAITNLTITTLKTIETMFADLKSN
jgi:hypothetical protein